MSNYSSDNLTLFHRRHFFSSDHALLRFLSDMMSASFDSDSELYINSAASDRQNFLDRKQSNIAENGIIRLQRYGRCSRLIAVSRWLAPANGS